MTENPDISIHGTEIDDELVKRLADLYVADFVDPDLREADPEFYSHARFIERMDDYKGSPKFAAYVMHKGAEIVGFATVANLIPNTAWWKNTEPRLSGELVEENNERTVAIFDLMIVHSHRGQGLASRLHEEILTTRSEERVTLLSSKPQQPAYSMWLHWNYKIVASKTDGDGPRLDVFLRPRVL